MTPTELPSLNCSSRTELTSRGRISTTRTALHFAAGAGGAAVGLLLRAGAEIGARDEDGATPLHIAIRRGCVTAVVALCQVGADPKAADNRGESPIDVLSATASEFNIAELEELRSALSA